MTGRSRDSGVDGRQDDHGVSVALQSLDVDGSIRFVDDKWVKLTDRDRGDVVGRPFVELLPEGERDAFEDAFDDAVEGDASSCAIAIRASDGTAVPIALDVRPEIGSDGGVSRIHCRLEPQRSTLDLKAYERLLEVAPVGVFRTTTDGRVLSVNHKLATTLGYDSPREAMAAYDDLGSDFYVDPQRREAFLERLLAEGAVEDFEYEAVAVDGQHRWLSMNARLLDEHHDGARVITGFTRDVTDRKQRDRQLAVLGRILRHNIRNALTVVQGQAELLRWERADAKDAVGTILERTDSLLRQAEKERALTELLRGSTESTARDIVRLAEIARVDVLETHPDATVSVDGTETATATVVDGFERALVELLDNALRHGDDLSVSVTVREKAESVEIAVADDGPGIPEIERELLCGNTDETPLFHGTGVGLFLVRQLVVRSNGTISVADNEPRGSVVTIRLPS
ncbi:sensor histidine kinase [Halapricum hydrolyticum]|uniref:PAS domain-containing sensor histidine kinase n=1 Tax=Halapricum hydrolyticum TaxID=2979991 RepID=A0AAE3IDU9_9EURY|nr:PAS domain-containing sensor histidine kinase [Halapricum hydrolyticum]MCU4717501.1 PAS domain-containing sensor histidine kinase [Halapricum hydrolyticum]MCU4726665.1 PAS domain-containing sensor histidine kinase [Halapricum hydrolyticum]